MNNSRLLKTLNYNAWITLANILFGFITNIFLVNQLGLNNFGNLSVVIIYSSIIYSISIFGLGSTLVHRFIHLRHINGNIKPLILILFFFVQFSALLILFLLNKIGIIFHFQLSNYSYIIFAVFLQTFLSFPTTIFTAYFESIQSLKIVFVANLFSIAVKFLGIISISFFLEKVLFAIIVIYLIPNLVSLIIIGRSFFKNYLKPKNNTIISVKDEFVETLSFSFKLSPVILAELILANFVFIFYSGAKSMENLAVIRILLGFFTMALTIPSIIGRTMLPFFSGLFIDSKFRLFNLYNSLTFKISFIFFCSISALLILLTREVLIIYKIDYKLYQDLYYLIVLMILLMFSSYQGSILISIGKPQYVSLILISGALVHVVFVFTLRHYFSLIGLLASLGFAYFVMQFILNVIIYIKLGFQYSYKLFLFFVITMLFQLISKNYLLDYSFCIRIVSFFIYLFFCFVYLFKFKFFNIRELTVLKFYSNIISNRIC